MDPILLFTEWRGCLKEVSRGASVIVHGSRFFGKQRLSQGIQSELGESASVLWLDTRKFSEGGEANFANLWEYMVDALGSRSKAIVQSSAGFSEALLQVLRRRRKRLIVIQAARAGYEEESFEIAGALHRVLMRSKREGLHFGVVVTDDFSLYYYSAWESEKGVSDFTSFDERIVLGGVSQKEIGEVLARVAGRERVNKELDNIAARISELTGGHPGLSSLLIAEVERRNFRVREVFWGEEARGILSRSHVLDEIREGLRDAAAALKNVATRHFEPTPVNDFIDAHLQYLRYLGVLLWRSPEEAEVYDGVIRETIRGLDLSDDGESSASRADMRGVLRSTEPMRIRSDVPEPSSSDVHVLQVSDLHLGENFGFRLPNADPGSSDLLPVAELLKLDLRDMGQEIGVDAIVISGDFTHAAQESEFLRARELVVEIEEKCGKDGAVLSLVAGNHDMNWTPGELAETEQTTKVSREGYDTLRELLGKKRGSRVDIERVWSRDKSRCILIVSLDSNWVEGPEARGVGYVAPEVLEEADSLVEAEKRDFDDQVLVGSWIVVHHHLFPATVARRRDALRRRVSVLANASEILGYAGRWGAELIMHGHEHQPCVTVAGRWPSDGPGDLSNVAVVGAGSLTLKRSDLGPFGRNHYYLLCRREDGVLVRSRWLSSTGLQFGKHEDLFVPL